MLFSFVDNKQNPLMDSGDPVCISGRSAFLLFPHCRTLTSIFQSATISLMRYTPFLLMEGKLLKAYKLGVII